MFAAIGVIKMVSTHEGASKYIYRTIVNSDLYGLIGLDDCHVPINYFIAMNPHSTRMKKFGFTVEHEFLKTKVLLG